ncbi:hypothetical protein AAKU55_002448 [Oxalobacteraceae bacterium GrIS 1.11]
MKQLPWTLLALTTGLIFWLGLAVVNAENQRNALITRVCADPVFKGEVDAKCLANIASRPHWWQHLSYAMSHLRP